MPELLREQGYRLNWTHLFLTSPVIPNAQTGIKWIERFHQNSNQQGQHSFLDQYLGWQIIGRLALDWIQSILFYLRNLKLSEDWNEKEWEWLWPVLNKDWEDSWIGPVVIQNILWIQMFDKMLDSLPRQRVGLYLMENQALNFKLVSNQY